MVRKLSNNYTNETKSQVKQADLVLLVCDFDGTLIPLPQTPDDVHMAETVHEHLLKLVSLPSVRLGVISARSPIDLKARLELPGCHYLCNHGLEISGPDLNYHNNLAEKLRDDIHRAAHTLRVQLRVEHALIEDRGLTAALNYRNVMESQVSSMLAKARNLLASAVRDRKIRLEQSRRKVEILPCLDWDRGKAVKMLHHTYRAENPGAHVLLLYVGDDQMDEPAFRYANQVGLSYRVTQTKITDARYYLKMQTEISRVLKIVRENAPDEVASAPKEAMVL